MSDKKFLTTLEIDDLPVGSVIFNEYTKRADGMLVSSGPAGRVFAASTFRGGLWQCSYEAERPWQAGDKYVRSITPQWICEIIFIDSESVVVKQYFEGNKHSSRVYRSRAEWDNTNPEQRVRIK